MNDKPLSKEEIDEVLALLNLGPLMSERAKKAIARAEAEDIRRISKGLAKAKQRSDDFRRRADEIRARLETSGALSKKGPKSRVKSLADARELLIKGGIIPKPDMPKKALPAILFLAFGHASYEFLQQKLRPTRWATVKGMLAFVPQDNSAPVVKNLDNTEEADEVLEGVAINHGLNDWTHYCTWMHTM